jgi:RNA polymerase sigma factor (sigma-70 family)
LSEKSLIRLAQSGDKDAFAQLVQLYSADAFRTASMVLRDHTEVEDVVQEAFLTCYRKLHTFRMESSFKTWLYRIVVNLCYDRLRKLNRDSQIIYKISNNPGTGNGEIAEVEQRLDLRKTIATLSPEHRLVLTLFYGNDFSVKKVSEVLGIPEGTVKSRLNSARNLLRERLERGNKYAL